MIYVWFTLRGIEQHRFVVCICISEFVLYLPVYGSGVSENGANPTIVILIKKIMINYNYKDLEPLVLYKPILWLEILGVWFRLMVV